MPEVMEAPSKSTPAAASKGVLFLSVYHHYDLPAIMLQKKLVTLENGNVREVEKQVTRAFYFKNHRALVSEEQAVYWRTRGMYGIHFIEAYPHPGIPRGSYSLYELFEKSPSQAQQFLRLMEHHSGRVQEVGVKAFTIQTEIMREGAKRQVREEMQKSKAEVQKGK